MLYVYLQLIESIEVDSDYRDKIVDAITIRNEDLVKAMVQATNHIAQASLGDFFWKLKVRKECVKCRAGATIRQTRQPPRAHGKWGGKNYLGGV